MLLLTIFIVYLKLSNAYVFYIIFLKAIIIKAKIYSAYMWIGNTISTLLAFKNLYDYIVSKYKSIDK